MTINRHPSMTCTCSSLLSLSRGTRSYAFSTLTKHAKTSFAYSQNFSKNCISVKIWSVVLRHGRKPHWLSSNFDSTLSRHFLLRHLVYTYPVRLKSDIRKLLRSSLLYVRMIRPVCQSFGVFPSFHATGHNLVNQRISSPFNLTFQVGFCLHQQPFQISIVKWLLPLLSM